MSSLSCVAGEAEWRLSGRKSSQLKKLQELEAPSLTIRSVASRFFIYTVRKPAGNPKNPACAADYQVVKEGFNPSHSGPLHLHYRIKDKAF
jgi:hypothetical protein